MTKKHRVPLWVIMLVSCLCISGAAGIPVIVGFQDATSALNATLSPSNTAELLDPDIFAVAMDISEAEIATLQTDPRVRYIEHDRVFSAGPDFPAADRSTITMTDPVKIPWNIRQIHADEVHAGNIDGRGVRVAVLDTGIDYTHPDLKGVYAGGYNYVGNSADPLDDNLHGTHCAGILAATGRGIVGTAPNVSLYAIKVLDSNGNGNLSGIIRGFYWARKNRMNVVSISIQNYHQSEALREAIDETADRGILVIAAAGNHNYSYVSTLANYSRVVSVGSVDRNNQHAALSNRGKVDISAPGEEIVSTIPGGTYQPKSGTSMAAPQVAGVAALILSKHPDWSAEQVRYQIVSTATYLGPADMYGAGLVNAANATWTA